MVAPPPIKHVPHELRAAIRTATDRGWLLRRSKKNHLLLTPPSHVASAGKAVVVLPSTPSDHRSMRNAISQLRRAGVPVPRK